MPNYSKKPKITQPGKGLDAIPWEEAREVYRAAAERAEDTLRAQHDSIIQERLAQMEANYQMMNPEAGAYEGNFSDHLKDADFYCENLEEIKNKAGQTALVTDFVNKYDLKNHSQVFLPQLVTWLAGLTLNRNSNGLISGKQFRAKHFTTDRQKGLWYFIMINSKSSYLETQYKGSAANFCALVPLVMYAHKLVHRVKYSEWDPAEINTVVNSELADAMLYKHEPISTEALLHERQEGLLIRSGAREGQSWSAVWKDRLYGPQLRQGPLAYAPKLAQVMLTQIWCAHPDNRSSYMILDPMNWDRVPPPLIEKEVVAKMPRKIPDSFYSLGSKQDAGDLPWDA